MNLFTIDESSNEVKVNSPFIRLIPEFDALFDGRTVGQKKGSYDKETYARKRLTYIYFMLDWGSPIAEWDVDERKAEALTYSGLSYPDVDNELVLAAYNKYEMLQYEKCRPLKTYRQLLAGMDKMDAYLADIDFNAVDKQGKLLFTTDNYTKTVNQVNASYDSLDKLKKRVDEAMSNPNTIRGQATMGDREMKKTGVAETWVEGAAPADTSKSFVELGKLLEKN